MCYGMGNKFTLEETMEIHGLVTSKLRSINRRHGKVTPKVYRLRQIIMKLAEVKYETRRNRR